VDAFEEYDFRARVTLAAGVGVELMMSVVDDDSDRQWQLPVPSTADKPRRMPTMRDVATDVVIRQLLEQRVDTQAPRAMIAEKAVDLITGRERYSSTQMGTIGADWPGRIPHLQRPYKPSNATSPKGIRVAQ
jgi:hypothetical protein